MGLFKKKTYDRSETLAAAAKARSKGKPKKAIAEYRKALEHAPDDPAILLAQAGEFPAAWKSFIVAGEALEQQGFADRALGVYAQAASVMPWHPKTWKAVARLRLDKGQRADAVKALCEGRDHLTRRQQRPEAIELLLVARQIDADDFELALDLAWLLRKEGRRDECRPILEGLAHRGGALRRVRGELFRLAPSFGAAWRWLRAALRGR